MEEYAWYAQLEKPFFAPSAQVFGPVWSVLYTIIAVSFGFVFVRVVQKKIPKSVAVPFVLNLVFNAAFTPLQFGLRSNLLAAIDVILVVATLVWAMKAVYPHAKWVTYAQIPYLLWGSFATVLQLSVTYLNW